MVSYGYLPGSGVVCGGAGSGDGDAVEVDGSITDKASIIRLLRVFVGALDDLQQEDSSLQGRPKEPPLLSPGARDKFPRSGDSPSPCTPPCPSPSAPACPSPSTPRCRSAASILPPTSRKRPRISSADEVNTAGAVDEKTSCDAPGDVHASPPGEPDSPITISRDPGRDKRARPTELAEVSSETSVVPPQDPAVDREGTQREGGEESTGHGQASAVGSSCRKDGRPQVTARDRAGCTLWDLAMDEKHAVIMCSCGLLTVCTAVLQDCAAADDRALAQTAPGQAGGVDGRDAPDAADAPFEVRNEPGTSRERQGKDLNSEEAARLREITCGILANVSSHRSLRKKIAGNAPLGEELLRAFHSDHDPSSLTEILRVFASMASLGERDGGPLRAVLVERQTLGRLSFFLENSLEEKLLARACWLLYVLMYRCGDGVIGWLLQEFAVEHALVSLLATRKGDLSYEKLAGVETGLGALLRCLEVLSTSDASSIGPSMRCATTSRAPANGSSSSCGVGAVPVGDRPLPNLPLDGGVARKEDIGVEPARDVKPAAARSPGVEVPSGESRAEGGAVGRAPASAETIRADAIRGLVQVLQPWDFSRECQQTSLLVLGNILEAAEESQDPRVHRQCSQALEDGLSTLKGDPFVDDDDEPDDEARGAASARDFLETVKDVSAGDGVDDEGLRGELRGAYATICRVLRVEGRP